MFLLHPCNPVITETHLFLFTLASLAFRNCHNSYWVHKSVSLLSQSSSLPLMVVSFIFQKQHFCHSMPHVRVVGRSNELQVISLENIVIFRFFIFLESRQSQSKAGTSSKPVQSTGA